MNRRFVQLAVVAVIVLVVLAGVLVGRIIEAIAVAAVLFTAWNLVRGWLAPA